MNKTPHYYAVVLTHEKIDYGELLKDQPDLLNQLKKAIFSASKDVFLDAAADGIDPPDDIPMKKEQP